MTAPTDRTARRHIREKATIDHVAEGVGVVRPAAKSEATVHSPKTSTGQIVEEQVRKEWSPRKGGLPIFNR